jgi:hypothetical protein
MQQGYLLDHTIYLINLYMQAEFQASVNQLYMLQSV